MLNLPRYFPAHLFSCAMGISQSTSTNREESTEESDSSEDHYTTTESDMDTDNDLTSDALETNNSQCNWIRNSSSRSITIQQIEDVESDLETYEKISLIYLLYDESYVAFQHMVQVLNNPHYSVLTEWSKYQLYLENNFKWKDKLLEAICIIQNYYVLKKLGFNKNDMYKRFLPLVGEISTYVNRTRKCLYRVCEDFTTDDTKRFLSYIERDLKEKKISYNFSVCNIMYLEMYLLYLETLKYIDTKTIDIKNVLQVFKYMELDNYYDLFLQLTYKGNACGPGIIDTVGERLSTYQDNTCAQGNIDTVGAHLSDTDNKQKSSSPTHELKSRSIVEDNSSDYSDVFDQSLLKIDKWPSDIAAEPKNLLKRKEPTKNNQHQDTDSVIGDSKYHIDPEHPGIILIINNKIFYTEFDKKLSHLLPPTNQKLETREGTEKDQIKLENTFRRLGYTVISRQNLTHEMIKETVKETVKQVDKESSLFIVILSHGDEGIVYGVNSIPVQVSQLQNIMCRSDTNLVGKPKVLILQSCQGEKCQQLNDDDDLQTDGPVAVPKTADMLVFWATLPGYSAVRHKRDGSWFIQSLCDKLIEKKTDHFADICVFVQKDVIAKRWKENIMVTLVQSTFSKFLYLPTLKQ